MALTAVYALLTLGVFASIVVLPWRRLPTWLMSVPGLVYCVALVCAREAEGGARSGLARATLAELVGHADQALYRAKSNGRDCLELVPA